MVRVRTDLEKNQVLIVANGVEGKSCGVITRTRTTKENIEQSVIDYVLITQDLENHMTECHIDEEKKRVLTKIAKTKQGNEGKERK